jgi:hypothetical protein
MKKPIKTWEVGMIAVFLIWIIMVYVLELSLLNMYTVVDSLMLFCCAVVIFLPAGVYLAIRITATENARWYKSVGYAIMASLFLVFMGYFTLLKTDLLWSLFTKPTTSGILYVKNVKKDYLPKHGWDHTNVNTIYNNKPLQFEASRTAFFLLKDKHSLNVTIGRSNIGNYFITDIHLPAVERWAARKYYLIDWVQRYSWFALFIIFAFIVAQLKMRYWPNFTFAQVGWKRFVILCAAMVAGIFVIIYIALTIYIKFTKTA